MQNAIKNNLINPLQSLDWGFSFENSLIKQCLSITPHIHNVLAHQELSFLYSTQYLAENNGEMALEHIRGLTYQPSKQNKIIDMQIKDELSHTKLLKQIVDKIGFDSHASDFADGYTKILYSVTSLSEKIFVFQIMTEAISSAYLKWRLSKIRNNSLNKIDQEIFNDEVRHLKMGKSLLEMCDKDELKTFLTAEKRRCLIREMSRMCSTHFSKGIKKIVFSHNLEDKFIHNATDLDVAVAKAILTETKLAAEIIEGTN